MNSRRPLVAAIATDRGPQIGRPQVPCYIGAPREFGATPEVSMTQALILVDIQNDYFPGGAMELVNMEAAATQAAQALTRFRARGLPVVHIQHLAKRPGATFFIPGTRGAELHTMVAPQAGETIVQKHFPNSFRDSDLLQTLQQTGVRALLIVGAMSHMCIDATTRAAFDLGFECAVAQDACATRDLQFDGQTIEASRVHAAFMAALAAPYAKVAPAAALLG